MAFGEKRKGGLRRRGSQSVVVQQFRTVVLFVVVLGALMLVVRSVLFMYYAVDALMFSTAKVSSSGAVAIEALTDNVVEYPNKVLDAYRSGARAADGGAGDAKFDAISSEERYKDLVKTLTASRPMDTLKFYVGVLDKETKNMIAVASSVRGDDTGFKAGSLVELPNDFMQSLTSSKAEKTTQSMFFDPEDGLCAISAAPLVEGNPDAGFVIAVAREGETLGAIISFAGQYGVSTLIVLAVMWFVIKKRVSKTIVEPMEQISNAAKGYREDRLNGEFGTSHFSSLDIKTGNEVEDLSHVLANMETDLANYVVDYAQLSAEREREKTELRMAAEIQRSALPDVFPPFPQRTEFDLFASMTPAREVGGDFYDFFLVDDDHLCLAIADVSDKGVPAALFMMNCKTELANHIMMGKSPAEALRDTNVMICASNRTRMFVTIWVGILQISTGMLVASNGGHEYPALRQPNGRFVLYNDRHALVVGGRPNTKYTDYRITLRPGSKLFVYTDGLPEATNASEKLFGNDRMVEALNEAKDATPKEVLDHMQQAVGEFVQDGEQFDDLTMLCLEYFGPNRERNADAGDA